MFRCFVPVARAIRPLGKTFNTARIISSEYKAYSTLLQKFPKSTTTVCVKSGTLTKNHKILDIGNNLTVPVPVRTVTKFSLKKGKRKTVKAVVRRFFRLHWGGWIRPKVGRKKKLWKKSSQQKRRLRQHVFCNQTQATLLDKMVTKFWKKPKYYVDDPYAPYHTREEFEITRKNPIVRHKN